MRLTKRAPDKWESARFTSIFLASSLSLLSNIIRARPLAGNANRSAAKPSHGEAKKVKFEMKSSDIYVQQVVIHWTKATRGMPGAAQRNHCAICFELSADEVKMLALDETVSQVTLREADDFVPQQSVVQNASLHKLDWRTVAIKQPKPDEVIVRYQYIDFLVGAPDRSHRPAISCLVTEGQLVRIEYNGRFAETGTNWYYVHCIFNIVRIATPTQEMFLAPPAHHLSDLAKLR